MTPQVTHTCNFDSLLALGSHEVTGMWHHLMLLNNEPDFFLQSPRPVFDGMIQWAMKAEQTMFWQSQ